GGGGGGGGVLGGGGGGARGGGGPGGGGGAAGGGGGGSPPPLPREPALSGRLQPALTGACRPRRRRRGARWAARSERPPRVAGSRPACPPGVSAAAWIPARPRPPAGPRPSRPP